MKDTQNDRVNEFIGKLKESLVNEKPEKITENDLDNLLAMFNEDISWKLKNGVAENNMQIIDILQHLVAGISSEVKQPLPEKGDPFAEEERNHLNKLKDIYRKIKQESPELAQILAINDYGERAIKADEYLNGFPNVMVHTTNNQLDFENFDTHEIQNVNLNEALEKSEETRKITMADVVKNSKGITKEDLQKAEESLNRENKELPEFAK